MVRLVVTGGSLTRRPKRSLCCLRSTYLSCTYSFYAELNDKQGRCE